jgi:hypothetical protein
MIGTTGTSITDWLSRQAISAQSPHLSVNAELEILCPLEPQKDFSARRTAVANN